MRKRNSRLLISGLALLLGFVLWTVLVQCIDVEAVGQNGTDLGFSTFNLWFHQLTGVHMVIYTITDWLGLVPIVVCLGFGVLGFIQLVGRRSLMKVDRDIVLLGVYYILVIACYMFFEMVPINYRPIPIDGNMEASYPSSTTLLVLGVMPTLMFQIRRRIRSKAIIVTTDILSVAFSVFMVLGRLVSGVHWATDIVGSVLLSAGLFLIYAGFAN